MHGLHHVIAGQLPETIIQPALFIILMVGAHQFLPRLLMARGAAGVNAAAAATALLVGTVMLRQYLPKAAKGTPPTYRTKVWISGALPLMLFNSTSVINVQAPLLLLGAIKGAETAGIYAVATRVSDLIVFALTSVNIAMAPTAARLWSEKDLSQLQNLVTRSARCALVFSLPIAASFIIFGERLLSIFGEEFSRGHTTLAILSVGQIINVLMGSVGVLLVIAGYAREVAIATAVCACLNIVLNLILIPPLGMLGTALAVTVNLIAWNVLLAVWVHRRLGIHSTALGRI